MGQGRGRRGERARSCVHAVGVTPPSVFPLLSCPAGAGTPATTSSSATATAVGCLVDGYFPGEVSVTWAGGSGAGTHRDFPAALRRSGRYSMGTRFSPAGAQGGALRCNVRHPASGFSGGADIPVSRHRPHRPPTVSLFHACDLTSVQLLCLVTGFAPAPVTAQWLVDDAPLSPAPGAEAVEPEAGGRTFRTASRLNVTLDDWRQKTYACRVTHPASGSTQQVAGHKCLSSPPNADDINVFILPPAPSDLYVSQSPKLRCVATSLPSDEGLVVSWNRKQGGSLRPDLLQLHPQLNGTFTATSDVPIGTRDWESGETFTCTVHHGDLPSPISRSISLKAGKRLAPSVYLMPPPSEELSGSRAAVSLTCLVRGFYPEDISVEWQKNQETLAAGGYDTTQAMKEKTGDASYFLYSRLVVEREEWNRGTTYVCMVVHEGLPMKFIQRSVNKNPGKK
ncbi:hypothetical protein QYF61_000002 [Mycteria americana]|uniref:Ig-like domain-containing protein n=1 Tax=Mycteria americana TaxID=33587 RepID=A0AAN7MHB7_MYCAM|nr:hypothetical protein QYF61_000002 [Mycteria americana]